MGRGGDDDDDYIKLNLSESAMVTLVRCATIVVVLFIAAATVCTVTAPHRRFCPEAGQRP